MTEPKYAASLAGGLMTGVMFVAAFAQTESSVIRAIVVVACLAGVALVVSCHKEKPPHYATKALLFVHLVIAVTLLYSLFVSTMHWFLLGWGVTIVLLSLVGLYAVFIPQNT